MAVRFIFYAAAALALLAPARASSIDDEDPMDDSFYENHESVKHPYALGYVSPLLTEMAEDPDPLVSRVGRKRMAKLMHEISIACDVMDRQNYQKAQAANEKTFKKLEKDHNDFKMEKDRQTALEDDLIAYGLFGLQDPLREEIKGSIQRCKESHIKVIMCTGDNIDTASAISRDAGILKKDATGDYAAMEGK